YWGWGHRVTNTGGQYLFDSVYILKLDADSILVKSTHFNFRFYFPDSLANKNNYTFKNPYIKNNLYYEQVLSVHFGDVTTRDISLFDGTTGINQDTKSLGAWRVYK
ncbi:MAG TPA: hypothetical protein VEB40_12945, partial [Flavipsychrobacter sp.]|nr:hypothetical protein [Flavipsychrobacter sp.]